jgi:hypothetical protein
MTFRLMPIRSSRLMPGLRGTPAVTMHDVGARRSRHSRWRLESGASKPSTGEDSAMSSALPCGMPSAMSNRTTSPSSLSRQCASVPPMLPAPIRARSSCEPCLRMGADDYIKKPFSQRLLIERIRALLRRGEARKETGTPAAEARPRWCAAT